MSQRIADASAKLARSLYPLLRMSDNVLSTSLGHFAELSEEVVPHSDVVKLFTFDAARQHADQAVTRRVARALGPDRIDRPNVVHDL
jgi:hypothetical protein